MAEHTISAFVHRLGEYNVSRQLPSFSDISQFYYAIVRKMVKIFPYDDRLTNDLVVLEWPNQTRWTNLCHNCSSGWTVWSSCWPWKRSSENNLRTTSLWRARKKVVYSNLLNVTEVMAMGRMQFSALIEVLVAVLNLQHSNADCDIPFSGKCIQSVVRALTRWHSQCY